jgi:hypothetical protein
MSTQDRIGRYSLVTSPYTSERYVADLDWHDALEAAEYLNRGEIRLDVGWDVRLGNSHNDRGEWCWDVVEVLNYSKAPYYPSRWMKAKEHDRLHEVRKKK